MKNFLSAWALPVLAISTMMISRAGASDLVEFSLLKRSDGSFVANQPDPQRCTPAYDSYLIYNRGLDFRFEGVKETKLPTESHPLLTPGDREFPQLFRSDFVSEPIYRVVERVQDEIKGFIPQQQIDRETSCFIRVSKFHANLSEVESISHQFKKNALGSKPWIFEVRSSGSVVNWNAEVNNENVIDVVIAETPSLYSPLSRRVSEATDRDFYKNWLNGYIRRDPDLDKGQEVLIGWPGRFSDHLTAHFSAESEVQGELSGVFEDGHSFSLTPDYYAVICHSTDVLQPMWTTEDPPTGGESQHARHLRINRSRYLEGKTRQRRNLYGQFNLDKWMQMGFSFVSGACERPR